MKKYFAKEKIICYISAVAGLLGLFFFFFPFLYSLESKTGKPVFISGFQMLSLMEDSYNALHYAVVLFLIGYVFSGMLFLSGAIGSFVRKEYLKPFFAINMLLQLVQFGCELAAVILFSGLSSMNLYLEFGSFVSVAFKGIALCASIGATIYLKLNSKNS
jgi:hypothetical protein